MKYVHGLNFTVSSFERGLWYDSDDKKYNPKGIGVKFNIVVGKLIFIVSPIYKLDYWKSVFRKPYSGTNYNPWMGGEYWYILRIPVWLGFYFSIAYKKLGLYFGTKTFQVEKGYHDTSRRYIRWIRPEELGTKEKPAEYLQFSISTRNTRWK